MENERNKRNIVRFIFSNLMCVQCFWIWHWDFISLICFPFRVLLWRTSVTVILSIVLQLCAEYQYFIRDGHSAILNNTLKDGLALNKIAQSSEHIPLSSLPSHCPATPIFIASSTDSFSGSQLPWVWSVCTCNWLHSEVFALPNLHLLV